MDYRITGARVLFEDDVVEAEVSIQDGRIADGAAGREVDGRGLVLAPAIVDIHGDAFERQVMPRPGVFVPLPVALADTDRQLAASGIATAYHALTLSWEPGLRSVERGAAFVDALGAARMAVDHRLQLRWEIYAEEAVPLIERVLAGPKTPAIAFNDHTSMTMRPAATRVTQRQFEFAEPFATVAPDDPELMRRCAGYGRRAGMTDSAYRDLLLDVWGRRPGIEALVRDVAAKGRAAGAPMLSHDDPSQDARDFYRGIGSRIAEFPMSEAVARDARAAGEGVVLGAPNVLRGGSHIGSLSAADMVEAGVCTILASDYYYPAMLAAVGRMQAERRAPLPQLWSTVSAGPAAALGLTDRGRIAPGLRADLVLLDWSSDWPEAVATFSGGRIAHLRGDIL